MIKTYKMLLDEFKEYKAPDNKIQRLVREKKIFKLTKGLYETDLSTPGYLLAGAIYGPSYISFDYALSYHGLIPEMVYSFTSATYKKGKKKRYQNNHGVFYYQDIPVEAYPYEILLQEELGYYYRIASAEKSLCDKLYSVKPVKNQKELKDLMFDDLRIDEDGFAKLDKNILVELTRLYPSTNLKFLRGLIKKYE